MVAKRPTGAYPKASKKANAKRVFEAGVKSGKIKSTEAGMTGAMVAKVAGKVISKVAKSGKAAKSAKAEKSSRQAYDYPVSGKSAKSVVPKLGKKSVDISENVSIKNATSPSGKVSIGGGANQVSRENLRITSLKYSNAEAKANARGLKAANKPTNKTGSKADRMQRAELLNQSNLIKNADPARPNRVRGGSLRAIKEYGGQGLATVKRTPKQAARQSEITKELNPVRKKKSK